MRRGQGSSLIKLLLDNYTNQTGVSARMVLPNFAESGDYP
jgi:hypothetical protein